MRKCSHLCQIKVDMMLIQLVDRMDKEKSFMWPLEPTDPKQEKLVPSCADKEGRKFRKGGWSTKI